MALVTIQRSPSSNNSPTSIDGTTGIHHPDDNNKDSNRNPKSLSECYFAGKGTALVLPAAEAHKSNRRIDAQGSNIRQHLQSIVDLLRPEETLKMAVKLESVHAARIRYLVIVSRVGTRGEESCLLGIDCNEKTTVGLVLKVMADTAIRLDGDGGFSVSVCSRHHIFKPVSVQAMWSALQTLHKVSSKARDQNYFQGGLSHDWVGYYEERIESERSCLNEWHAMDNLESKRPRSPDSIRTKPTEREETEKVIRSTLKEIMMSVDLDEVTSKYIRTRLEEELDMDLGEYKSFIDQEMLTILGQMDAPTEIFDHVYLGSEWNASNYEELQRNGVGHILNVTREIDNFFPGTFDYLNVRVYDDEKTDLLKHWDDTFKYITKARKNGSKVLVHCKMGVSRSASVVIAYAMKAYNWDFETAMHHVKDKRNCIKPNTNFLSQLETYQGILDAMKNKEKLQRSKSETNLKSPMSGKCECKVLAGSEATPIVQAFLSQSANEANLSGQDLRLMGARPKSWSPDDNLGGAGIIDKSPVFLSLEDLSQKSTSKESVRINGGDKKSRHVLMPCDNGESYSVSPNQIFHLPNQHLPTAASVKDRINELEMNKSQTHSEKTSPVARKKKEIWDPGEDEDNITSNRRTISSSDPSSSSTNNSSCDSQVDSCSSVNNAKNNNDDDDGTGNTTTVWTCSTIVKNNVSESLISSEQSGLVTIISNNNNINNKNAASNNKSVRSDPFSNQLDRVFDREEKKQQRISVLDTRNTEELRESPSRQSSWSSYDSAVIMGSQTDNTTLSRHSSWGSGDNTRLLPSRNSSWGSYDMKPRGPVLYTNEKGEKVLSNNSDLSESSSSGIFAYDKEDIPWHPGTVKRTKQKIEDNMTKSSSSETLFEYNPEGEKMMVVEAVNPLIDRSISAISGNINIEVMPDNNRFSSDLARLSVSAPENSTMDLIAPDNLSRSASNVSQQSSVVSTAQCSSVKEHRAFLENLKHKKPNFKIKTPPEKSSSDEKFGGKVQSLKKEFEAKTIIPAEQISNSNSNTHQDTTTISTMTIESKKNKINSLPTSPVSLRDTNKPPEDLNFRNLLGLFEKNNTVDHQVSKRPKNMKCGRNYAPGSTYSCIEVSMDKSPIRINGNTFISNLGKSDDLKDDFRRPPIPPVVQNASPSLVVATVIAKANNKKQQQYGRSHPLARLNIKAKHNNPLYNTM